MKDFTMICAYLEAVGMAASGFALLGLIYYGLKEHGWTYDGYDDGSPDEYQESYEKNKKERGDK
ncbi:MAG TPA: hypothetical protein PK915_02410 [Bacteroidales bacterium]|nr:hypothetical protein [Bacteroidales bacterium]